MYSPETMVLLLVGLGLLRKRHEHEAIILEVGECESLLPYHPCNLLEVPTTESLEAGA